MRSFLVVCALAFAGSVSAQEDYRVMKLEQDVRTLERQVQSLERLVSELERSRRADPTGRLSNERAAAPVQDDPAWLKASAWNRVRTGMSELEVIEILGKPTALRPDASNRRALLYTLEVGTMSFLTGSVFFAEGKAVEIQKPALR